MSGWEDEWSYVSTDYKGGELSFTTETLEELFKRLHAAANNGHTVTETERRALHKAYKDYLDWYNSQPRAAPSRPPPKPKSAAPKTAPVESKPSVQDGRVQQAAPHVSPPATPEKKVGVEQRPPAAEVSREKSVEAHQGQLAKEADEVLKMVSPPPASETERQSILTSIQRNESPIPGQPHPTHSDPFSRAPASGADPVDLFTGTFTIDHVDLEVPTAHTDITLERHYRSGRPYYGPFGYGWDHNHNCYLRPLNNGTIAFWNGRLREQSFLPNGGGWKPAHGLAARIERVTGFSDVFEVYFPGGICWHFERPIHWNSPGRIPLARVKDRYDNAVHYTYDGADRLQSVLDGAGRGLVFSYGQCGLLERIEDHSGTRAIQYGHHPEIEHLESVTLPATAQYPGGIRTRYVYDMHAAHPAMRHNIVRVIDADGRTYLENTFAGPKAGWSFNAVVHQLVGGHEYQFEYEQIQFVPYDEFYLDILATRTLVGYPDGTLHIYTFNYRGDLLDHRFRANRDRSYRVIATQYLYDAAGNVTETVDPEGVRHVLTYDAANPDPCARLNLLRVELAAPIAGGPTRTLLRAQYDPKYQLPKRIIDESGQETLFEYDFDNGVPNANGRLERIKLPPVTLPDASVQQSSVSVEYSPQGRLLATVDADGTRTVYDYLAGGPHDGFLGKTLEDALGLRVTTEYTYDAVGFSGGMLLPGGHSVSMRYNALGQLEDYAPPSIAGASPIIRRRFSDNGSVVRVDTPVGDYADPVKPITSIVDIFERDVLDRVVVETRAANTVEPRSTRRRNNYHGLADTFTDPSGLVSEYRYDERGAPLRETVGFGLLNSLTTRYAYDRCGRLVRVVDPIGRTTRIVRDLWGRPKAIHLPSGAVKHLLWGPGDVLVESWTDWSPPGQPTRRLEWESFDYDERGRKRADTRWSFVDDHISAIPLTTSYFHDARDRIRKIRLPRGGMIQFGYDALARPVRAEDPYGNIREFAYDAAGNLVQETVSELESGQLQQHVITHSYDARRRKRAFEGGGTRVEFDYDDRNYLVEMREAGGVITRFENNAFGETTARLVDAGGLAITSSCEYDPMGRMTRYVDPLGAETRWSRESLGLPESMTLADGSEWRFSYDLKARTSRRIAPSGGRIDQQFDEVHDRVSRFSCTAAAGLAAVSPHEFHYDGLGRLSKAKTASNEVERQYDSFSRLVLETTNGKSVAFDYDDLSGFVDLVFPDGRRERTVLDQAGRPIRVELVTAGSQGGLVGEKLVQVTYRGARRPGSVLHSNGVSTSLVYDDPGRMIRIEHGRGGVSLESYRTRMDERGRRAIVQYTGPPARTLFHDFDRVDRLRGVYWGFPFPALADVTAASDHAPAISTAAGAAGGAPSKESYQLDEADGRKERVRVGGPAGTTVYDRAVDHRVIRVNGQPVSYHIDGHQLSDGRFDYDLDALGRVLRVRNAESGVIEAECEYDALSRVATGSIAGEPFLRWFGGAGWIHEVHGIHGDIRQATPHPLWPHPLCIRDAGSSYFLHPDGALSTTCITNELGQVVERHRYGPFGTPEIFQADGTTAVGLGASVVEPVWRGMPMLGDAALYVTPWRLYNPELGVFTGRDPLLYGDSPNPFVFAGHNPIDFADPTGLAKSPVQPRGHSITPLPPVGGDTFQPGFAWVQYTGALNDVFNPDTPIWAKVVLVDSLSLRRPWRLSSEPSPRQVIWR